MGQFGHQASLPNRDGGGWALSCRLALVPGVPGAWQRCLRSPKYRCPLASFYSGLPALRLRCGCYGAGRVPLLARTRRPDTPSTACRLAAYSGRARRGRVRGAWRHSQPTKGKAAWQHRQCRLTKKSFWAGTKKKVAKGERDWARHFVGSETSCTISRGKNTCFNYRCSNPL